MAVTGGTGFVGRHAVAALREAGHEVRALARRDDAALAATGAILVPGSLESEAGLRELVEGADAVVHVAGTVRAPDRATFLAVNVEGTERVAEAAAADGHGRRLVYLSSLTAREPGISPYAESKMLGERAALRRSDRLDVVVVRPPAVYGPGDHATLPILRSLARGWLLAPANQAAARFSLLFAPDLGRLIAALANGQAPSGGTLEPDDGRPGGYAWRDLAVIAQDRLARRVRTVGVPRSALAIAAGLAERYTALQARFPLPSTGKVAELFHRDWVSDTRTMVAVPGWRARTGFADGLPLTLEWYRRAGWL
ncbi:MAG TPA: NAD-dependent epimerase/dehydratase family protein [Geminicoccaceae bacterium]|nr:NAD-dependent epimerase/dehydratase family protein [Geminicoccaceae bacterium]